MNFSDNDLTGVLAEQDVERLFTSWRWVIGKDRIDIGYDLSVVPDISRFKGARFLVQSKGTAKRKKGAIVAQVSKSRLKQYAENPHPVFIVRVTPDGTIYWVHAQEWAKINAHKLNGDGFSGVKFDKNLTLNQKESFVQYLDKVMRPAHEKMSGLKEISDKRGRYLSEIDPRFTVKAHVVDGKETYEILPVHGAGGVLSEIAINPVASLENIEKIHQVIDFGIPASFDIDGFKMGGSPLFDEIGINRFSGGRVEVKPNNVSDGFAFVRPGSSHSITAAEISIPARLFSGKKGAVITNEGFDKIFGLKLKIEPGAMNAKFFVNQSSLCNRSARYWDELAHVVDWVDQVLEKGAIRIEINFRGNRDFLPAMEDISNIKQFLFTISWLGKLHALAKYFSADVFLSEDFELTNESWNDVEMFYRILRGDRCSIQNMKMEFNADSKMNTDVAIDFYATTNLCLSVADQEIGSMPVKIDLRGYRIIKKDDINGYKTECENDGDATISFFEGEADGVVRRE